MSGMRTNSIALLLGCAVLWSPTAYPLEPDIIFERVSPSVWLVRTLDINERPLNSGSAVVVAPGRVITNCHVLARAKGIQIRKGNMSLGAKLEYPDPERDLCQLSVQDLAAPPVQQGTISSLKVGQRVYAIGNPRGLELSMSEGIISSLRSLSGDSPLVQTTAPISKGSSGGGLFDSEGRLIGFTTFALKDSQNLNFALPVDWVAEIPERAKLQLEKFQQSKSAPVAQDGEAAVSAEKPLTGQKLDSLFQSGKEFRVENGPGTLEKITFHSNGYVDLNFSRAFVDFAVGTYTLESSSGKLCMQFPADRGSTAIVVTPFNDCYTIFRISEKKFRFKANDNSWFIAES